jgi:hypothetical protein
VIEWADDERQGFEVCAYLSRKVDELERFVLTPTAEHVGQGTERELVKRSNQVRFVRHHFFRRIALSVLDANGDQREHKRQNAIDQNQKL